MNYSLNDKLFRIQRLIYNKKGLISEQEAKIDDPKKADLVSSNVDDFFKTLDDAAKSGGLTQQRRGEMQYQKTVESMQIGLTLLGYELPRHGIDGLFGPETAAVVEKFKSDNKIGEKLNESMLKLKATSYSNVKFDSDGTQNDYVNKGLLDDINKAAAAAGVTVTITTAKTGHSKYTKSGNISRHWHGTGVDIAIINGVGANGANNAKNGNPKFREYGHKLANALESLGYKRNSEAGNTKAFLWHTNTGGNHYNHLHISNTAGASDLPADAQGTSSSSGTLASPEMLKIMIDKLKVRGVKPEELKKLIDSRVSGSLTLSGDWIDITKQLLRKYEGFSEGTTWDENAYRGGYGTDKKLVNGRLIDATKQTTWTRQEAEETMDYEIRNTYAPIIVRQLGKENWDKLNDKQKAALVSLGYNAGPYFVSARDYGKNIKKSIENGDMESAANYIRRGPTTGSVSGKYYSQLQKRRNEEAQLFLS